MLFIKLITHIKYLVSYDNSELYSAALENDNETINRITSRDNNKTSYSDLDQYLRNSNTGEDDDSII